MSRSTFVALFLALGATAGAVLAVVVDKTSDVQPIEWLKTSRSLPDFKLRTEGGVFDRRSLDGRWSVVLFGFLHCPDACPTGLQQMAKLAAKLSATTGGGDVAFIFVSVDPRRDSAAELAQFVRHFESSIVGVTGSEDQLGILSSSLGVTFKASSVQGNYTVSHSTWFSIIGPDGTFRGRFRAGNNVFPIASELSSRFHANPF